MNEDDPPGNTSLAELLDQLIVPDPPVPVSMAPQTVGWAVLGVIMVLVLGFGIWRYVRHFRANAYRRAAIAELSRAGDDPGRIAEVLRRTALEGFGRRQVAALSGPDWVAFLERTGAEPWGADLEQPLLAGPYRAGTEASPQLADRAARWIRTHNRKVQG